MIYKKEFETNGKVWLRNGQPICSYFTIDEVFLYERADRIRKETIIKIRQKHDDDGDEVLYLNLEKKRDLNGILIFPGKEKEVRKLIRYLTEIHKQSRGVKIISCVGYCYQNHKWIYTIANKDGFEAKDLLYLIYGTEKLSGYLYPSVSGSLEEWKKVYRKIYQVKDPILLLIIGHFLTHVLNPYLEDTELKKELNPIILIRGRSASGKTLRLHIASALYGVPTVINITKTTIGAIEYKYSRLKIPLPLETYIIRGKKKILEAIDLIEYIAKEERKRTAVKILDSISVPTVITGEPNHIPLDKIVEIERKILGMILYLPLDDFSHYNENFEEHVKYLRVLKQNHGFTFKFIEFIESLGRNLVEKHANELATYRPFETTFGIWYKGLDNLVNRITLALELFADFLELGRKEKYEAIEETKRVQEKIIWRYKYLFLNI